MPRRPCIQEAIVDVYARVVDVMDTISGQHTFRSPTQHRQRLRLVITELVLAVWRLRRCVYGRLR